MIRLPPASAVTVAPGGTTVVLSICSTIAGPGTASPIGDGQVPPELEGDALLAVDNCPEYAITTTDD